MGALLFLLTVGQILHLTVLALLRPRLLASATMLLAVLFLAVFSVPILIRFELFSGLGLPHSFFLVAPVVVGLAQCLLQFQFVALRRINRGGSASRNLSTSQVEASTVLVVLGVFVSVAVLVIAVVAWFFPLACSGLYSLIFDPSRALLARDITLKSNSNPLVTAAISALANVLGPAIGALGVSVLSASSSLLGRWRYLVGGLAIVFATSIVLIPAIDGNVLVLLISMLMALTVAEKSTAFKSLLGLVLAGVMVPIMLFVDGAPRMQDSSQRYDVGFCVGPSVSPEDSLLLSLADTARPGFGFSQSEWDGIGREISDVLAEHRSVPQGPEFRPSNFFSAGEAEVAQEIYDNSEAGILNRILRVPVQTASAYFIYAEHASPPATDVFPFAFLWGRSTNPTSQDIAALVSALSGSSVSPGSTAGSNSAYVWTSAIGLAGLSFALSLTALFLLLQNRLLARREPVVSGLGAALGGVFVMNYIESDLWSVVFSHSGYLILIVFVSLWLRSSASREKHKGAAERKDGPR